MRLVAIWVDRCLVFLKSQAQGGLISDQLQIFILYVNEVTYGVQAAIDEGGKDA